jgi:hypothetical protein
LKKHARSHQALWREFASRLAQHRVQLEAAQGRSNEQTDWRSIVHGSYRRTWRFMRNKSHMRALKLPTNSESSINLSQITPAPNDRILVVRSHMANLYDISSSCQQEAPVLSSWKTRTRLHFAALLDDTETLLVAFNDYSKLQARRRIGVRSIDDISCACVLILLLFHRSQKAVHPLPSHS